MKEIIEFKNLRWQEISEQDNPAYDYINHKENRIIRNAECIIICKVADIRHSCVGDGYVVIFVPYIGDVIRRGLFWNYDDAVKFANSICDKDKE